MPRKKYSPFSRIECLQLLQPDKRWDVLSSNVCGERAPKYFSRNRPGGGGGTPLYGLYRYVPRNRVWFLEALDP